MNKKRRFTEMRSDGSSNQIFAQVQGDEPFFSYRNWYFWTFKMVYSH